MPTDGPPRDDNPLRTPEATRDRLVELRADFARLAENGEPLAARILQNDTGIKDRGNDWIPEWRCKPLSFWPLCRTAYIQRTDADGNVAFTQTPTLDAGGNAITNTNGEAFDVQLPVTRTILIGHQSETPEALEYWRSFDLATVTGGAILDDLRSRYKRVLDGWNFKGLGRADPATQRKSRWWTLLFELAKDDDLPGIHTKERTWNYIHPLLVTRAIDSPDGTAKTQTAKPIIRFMMDLPDPARACCVLCDLLLAELGVYINAQSPTLADTDANGTAPAPTITNGIPPAKTPPRKPAKNLGGAKSLPEDEETMRADILAKWDEAKEARISRQEFCDDAGITIEDLKRFMDWRGQRTKRHESRRQTNVANHP
jgi:hypothetical protein